jgi:hypothetical protein
MIWQLIKRDPAWKMAPWFGMVVLAVAVIESHGRLDSLVMQLPVFIVLLAIGAGATEEQAGTMPLLEPLPIALREVYLARVAGMLAMAGTMVCAPAVLLLLAPSGRTSVFIEFSLISTPILLFLQSLAICRSPHRLKITILLLTGLAMVFAIALVKSPGWLNTRHTGLAPVSGLISVLIFGWTWSYLPRVADGEWKPKRAEIPVARFSRARRNAWWLYNWKDVVWMGIVFLQTIFGIWFNAMLFFWSLSIQTREYIRWMDSLPVNRRFLLAARLAPPLIALALGYVAAMEFGWGSSWNRQLTLTTSQQWPPDSESPAQCRMSNVQPPIDYWRPARNRRAPVIQAPWGESFQPPVVHVFGLEVYDPFAVGCDNSQRFSDWQYERASLAVYGRWVRPDRTPTAVPPARSIILNIGAMWTCALASLFPVALADYWRFRRLPMAVRTWVLVLIAGSMFTFVFVPEMLPGMRDLVYRSGNPMQWFSWQLPDSLAIVIALSVAAPLATYLSMERLFLRGELTQWGARAGQTPGNYT